MASPEFKPAQWQDGSFDAPLKTTAEYKARCRKSTGQQLQALKSTPEFKEWERTRGHDRRTSSSALLPKVAWALVFASLCAAALMSSTGMRTSDSQEVTAARAAAAATIAQKDDLVRAYKLKVGRRDVLVQRREAEVLATQKSLQEKAAEVTMLEARYADVRAHASTVSKQYYVLSDQLRQTQALLGRQELAVDTLQAQLESRGGALDASLQAERPVEAAPEPASSHLLMLTTLVVLFADLLLWALSLQGQTAAPQSAASEKATPEFFKLGGCRTPQVDMFSTPEAEQEQEQMLCVQEQVAALEQELRERNCTIVYHNNLMNTIQESLMEATGELAVNRRENLMLKKRLTVLERELELERDARYSVQRYFAAPAMEHETSSMDGIVHPSARTPCSAHSVSHLSQASHLRLLTHSPHLASGSSAASAQSESRGIRPVLLYKDERRSEDSEPLEARLSTMSSFVSSVGKENGPPLLCSGDLGVFGKDNSVAASCDEPPSAFAPHPPTGNAVPAVAPPRARRNALAPALSHASSANSRLDAAKVAATADYKKYFGLT